MADSRLSVRSAQLSDADVIAPLLGQLGYPADAREVSRRLDRILRRGDGGVLIGEIESEAIALISYQLIDLLERSQPQCRITTLVVAYGHRRRGAASALIGAVESIARERGCFRLEVMTRPRRTEALGFYTALGFDERRRRLVKGLPPR